jgi:hypothetical protein
LGVGGANQHAADAHEHQKRALHFGLREWMSSELPALFD